ncbi:hypothetical protein ABFS82_05G094300 [Erythranthe guttata]
MFYYLFLAGPSANSNVTAASNSDDQPRILYHYQHVISGFAAKLSAADVEAMRQKKGFISARPERMYTVLIKIFGNRTETTPTTHSPNFMGLNQNTGLRKNSSYGKGVIIGMVDMGVELSHPSFADGGMLPPPPVKWKGKCQFLIGELSPLTIGHGTHTASTAAGNFVGGAGLFGNAGRNAAGIAPLAHLSIYQACGFDGCPNSAVAAAIDAAIDDGKGIFVSCSAGNDGFVGTTDRKITTTAVLGNGEQIDGETAKGFPSIEKLALFGQLDVDVRGKIVVCDNGTPTKRIAKGVGIKNAGGAAMILVNTETQRDTTSDDVHALRAMQIGTLIGGGPAPVLAAFSSRGPSTATPGILKPDIIGPGDNILAAWPFSLENKTDTKSTFNIISGTSMSCPHLSGVAALLKSVHPDWSIAAIKSGIMTTAYQVNLKGNPIKNEQLQPATVYTNQHYGIILGCKVDCAKEKSILEAQLNYPSFSIIFGSTPQNYTRTLTNVGKDNLSYDVEIVLPDGVNVKVEPNKLVFPKLGDKSSYNMTFTRTTKGAMNSTPQGFSCLPQDRHGPGAGRVRVRVLEDPKPTRGEAGPGPRRVHSGPDRIFKLCPKRGGSGSETGPLGSEPDF